MYPTILAYIDLMFGKKKTPQTKYFIPSFKVSEDSFWSKIEFRGCDLTILGRFVWTVRHLHVSRFAGTLEGCSDKFGNGMKNLEIYT